MPNTIPAAGEAMPGVPPAMPPAVLRARMAHAVERLLAALDALDAVTEDLEEDNPPEPSLGAPEHTTQTPLNWAPNGPQRFNGSANQEHWSDGGTAHDEIEVPDDDEPSLGVPEQMNQERVWSRMLDTREDLEFEGDSAPECDREPSLGSIGSCGLGQYQGQQGWAQGAAHDQEENVEDQGQLDTGAESGSGACFADDEPSLASTHDTNQEVAWGRHAGWEIEDGEATGTTDDLDMEPPTEEQRKATLAKIKEVEAKLPKPTPMRWTYGPDGTPHVFRRTVTGGLR